MPRSIRLLINIWIITYVSSRGINLQYDKQKLSIDTKAHGLKMGMDLAKEHLDRQHEKEIAAMTKKEQTQTKE